jgi:predicted RNase H-like HicB family nuclease
MAEIVWALVHEADGPKGRVFGISFPDFPGVASGGRTVDEAIQRGRETLTFHMAGMVEDGDALPALRSIEELRADQEVAGQLRDVRNVCLVEVPLEMPSASVRVNISIENHLLNAVDRVAKNTGMTRSAFLADAARDKIKKLLGAETASGLDDDVPKSGFQEGGTDFLGAPATISALTQNVVSQIDAIQLCMKHHYFSPSLVLIYSGIDFFASLSRPASKADVTRVDFVSWVEKYMRCGEILGVTGNDLYAARCGMVHTYSPDSRLHREGSARRIMYTWGNQEAFEANALVRKLGYSEVFLKIETLISAFLLGVDEFGKALKGDPKLEKLVESRGGKLLAKQRAFP